MHKFSPSFSKELIKWFMKIEEICHGEKTFAIQSLTYLKIMLQQTRVEQVTSHFNRWIKIFLSLKSLINANEQEVLKAWEGLGYYSRRSIYKSAQIIKNQHNGRFPRDPIFIESLPGIGPYTKAAICSISLNLDTCCIGWKRNESLGKIFLY